MMKTYNVLCVAFSFPGPLVTLGRKSPGQGQSTTSAHGAVVCSSHGWFFGALPGLPGTGFDGVRNQAFAPRAPPPASVRSGGDALQGSGTCEGRRFAVILVPAGLGSRASPHGQQPRTTLARFGPLPMGRGARSGGTEGATEYLMGQTAVSGP